MGDPKFSRRKYDTPAHPWEGDRIKAENELLMKYGLKNKRELWRAQSFVRVLRAQSRDLQARLRAGDPQAKVETDQLLKRCARMALLPIEGATLNEVLAINTEAILARRFQTLLYRKGLAHTPSQARQLIVHGHASVSGRKVTIPGYMIKRGEEEAIAYHGSSPLMNELHPCRPKPEELAKLKAKEEATVEVKEKDEIHVATPKLKKIIKTELKEEKEGDMEIPAPAPEAEEPEKKE